MEAQCHDDFTVHPHFQNCSCTLVRTHLRWLSTFVVSQMSICLLSTVEQQPRRSCRVCSGEMFSSARKEHGTFHALSSRSYRARSQSFELSSQLLERNCCDKLTSHARGQVGAPGIQCLPTMFMIPGSDHEIHLCLIIICLSLLCDCHYQCLHYPNADVLCLHASNTRHDSNGSPDS